MSCGRQVLDCCDPSHAATARRIRAKWRPPVYTCDTCTLFFLHFRLVTRNVAHFLGFWNNVNHFSVLSSLGPVLPPGLYRSSVPLIIIHARLSAVPSSPAHTIFLCPMRVYLGDNLYRPTWNAYTLTCSIYMRLCADIF